MLVFTQVRASLATRTAALKILITLLTARSGAVHHVTLPLPRCVCSSPSSHCPPSHSSAAAHHAIPCVLSAMAASPPRRLLLLVLLLTISSPSSSSSRVGINYGQVANNLPPPEAAVPLLRSIGVSRVKIYDADPTVLHAFADTGVEFVVGLADECVARVCDPNEALTWVKTNIAPFAPRTKISAVTIGNEVLTRNSTALAQNLLPAMQSIHAALAAAGLDKQVVVTTAHSFAVLEKSYPPSAGVFRRDLAPYIREILNFQAQTGSPFLINAYPYFAYKADPKGVSLDYALFQPNPGVVDPVSGLHYENMLHAQVDAVHTAIERLMGKGQGVEVRVSETGWPSNGDPDEAGATVENARKYNANLVHLVSQKKGTPLKPDSVLQAYVFALFNENLKPGPASERNYGLFKPDGTPVYQLGITAPNDNSGGGGGGGSSSDSGGSSGGGGGDGAANSFNPSYGYYSMSSATKKQSFLTLPVNWLSLVAVNLIAMVVPGGFTSWIW